MARRADEWCTPGAGIDQLHQRLGHLDVLAQEAGRNPRDIARSVMSGVLVGRSTAELRRRANRLADLIPEFAGLPPETILDRLVEEWQWWVGSPQLVAEQVRAVIQAGADQIFLQLFDFRDARARSSR